MEEPKTYTLEELKELLKPEHLVFAEEYCFDWNGSRSYKVAYPESSDETARVNASKLLTNTNIKQFIEEVQKDLGRQAGISRLKVLKEFEKIAFYGNVASLFTSWTVRKTFEEIKEANPEIMCSISEIQTQKKVQKGADNELTEVEYVKVKLHDKQKALENINKMCGYNEAEKHDHSSKDGSMTPRIGKVIVNRPTE
jgi:phage terminase small subunit